MHGYTCNVASPLAPAGPLLVSAGLFLSLGAFCLAGLCLAGVFFLAGLAPFFLVPLAGLFLELLRANLLGAGGLVGDGVFRFLEVLFGEVPSKNTNFG